MGSSREKRGRIGRELRPGGKKFVGQWNREGRRQASGRPFHPLCSGWKGSQAEGVRVSSGVKGGPPLLEDESGPGYGQRGFPAVAWMGCPSSREPGLHLHAAQAHSSTSTRYTVSTEGSRPAGDGRPSLDGRYPRFQVSRDQIVLGSGREAGQWPRAPATPGG